MSPVSPARSASGGATRRTVLTASVTASVALAATACASDSSSGSGSRSSGGGSFTYWSMWKESEPQAKVIKAAIAAFTKDTGVQVTVQWKGRQVVKQLGPTLNTAHVPADLVDSSDRFAYSGLQAVGQALDLTPVLSAAVPGESGKVSDVIPKHYLDLATTSGVLWQMPYEILTTQIWYNGRSLPSVAANPPGTWAEFTALIASRKSARGGSGPLALDGDIADYSAYWTYFAVLRELGAGAFAAAAADKTGASFESPGFLTAFGRIEALVAGGDFVPGYDGSKWPAVQDGWAGGKSDFLLLGTFAPSETQSFASSGFTYRSFPFPAVAAGGDESQDISLIGFSIPKKARNAAAAQRFIAYFLAKARLEGISAQAGNLTPRADIAAPAQLADAQKALSSGKVVKALDGVKETAADWYTKVFCPLNTTFLDGGQTAAQFAAKLKSGTAQYWSNAE
ncbi:extracellular solute-binding protein [Actinospica sp. MGRD01-02]|uniref:Extracellular solute-binding protein n=1 Tax=Actinospica acidithermotolerans TaxID=2828514 RepID=A0A941IME7_9ACTN|nr:ABC transporter substrate-binding protein [Actinospica acidithermotolerans]MBR7831012.1 extracellular solute-binding protein [Actinospica acidithermotolerans]